MRSTSCGSLVLVVALAVVGPPACYWPYWTDVEDIEDQCIEVCDRVDDCSSVAFDVSDCIDDCTDRSLDSSSFEDAVDDCAACLSGTCGEATDCGFDCEDIVDVDIIEPDVSDGDGGGI